MSSVKLAEVSRKFGSPSATSSPRFIGVDNISFEIPDGEFWVLVGPSGCGKSTLLRIIAGLETLTSGHVYIGDRAVDNVPARQRDVAMVFQNYALYPHMTVAENLGFGMQMRGVDKATIKTRVNDVAKTLQIDHLLDRKPKQLSGGQQQRVALGRAIARSPQVFLLDEPLSNLDASLRDNTRSELKQLHQQVPITTIYVTHDCVEAMTLADRIVVLDRGYIQQIGTPQEIYHLPANQMVATFIGTPPMNIIPAIYQQGKWQIGDCYLPCDRELAVGAASRNENRLQLHDGQGFNLGIRPERIVISANSALAEVVATVRSLEALGRETILTAQINGTTTTIQLIAPMDSSIGATDSRELLGKQLSLELPAEALFIFDPSTGNRLFPN